MDGMSGASTTSTSTGCARRRTVKWSLYGPDVLAAWVAEMDFDVAPVVRPAILDAVDREDFGYVEADLGALDRRGRRVPRGAVRLDGAAGPDLPGRRRAHRHRAPRSTCSSRPARRVVVPTPAYPPFFEVVELTGRPVVAAPMARDRRPRHARPRRDRRRARGGRARGAALQPAQPDRPRVHRRRARRAGRDRRPARRAGRRRRGARAARVRRRSPRAVRVGVGRGRRAHGHGHVGVEGVQPRRAEVRAGRRDEPRRRGALARPAACSRSPGPTPLGIAASTAAYRDGGPWLDELVGYLDGNRDRLGELLAAELPGVALAPAARRRSSRGSTARRSASTTRPASSSTTPASR